MLCAFLFVLLWKNYSYFLFFSRLLEEKQERNKHMDAQKSHQSEEWDSDKP